MSTTPAPPAAVLPGGLTVDQVARTTDPQRRAFLAEMRTTGACRSRDPELFFPLPGHGTAHREQVEEATAVCRTCPLTSRCLTYALSGNVEYGIWGGTTEPERRPLMRAVHTRREQIAAEKATADTVWRI